MSRDELDWFEAFEDYIRSARNWKKRWKDNYFLFFSLLIMYML